jgi:hypothetical protein
MDTILSLLCILFRLQYIGGGGGEVQVVLMSYGISCKCDTKECTGQIICCAFSPWMKSLDGLHAYQTKLVHNVHDRINVTVAADWHKQKCA